MTETAQTVIDLFSTFARWIDNHIVGAGEIVRQLVPVLVVLGVVHLTIEQQAVIFSAISGVVAAVTGNKTTSNVRVGQRIEAEVERRTGGTGDVSDSAARALGSGQ